MTQWQPIATAPRDGTQILVVMQGRIIISDYYVRETYRNGKLDYRSEGWSTQLLWLGEQPEPAHWMPLPELPVSISAEAVAVSISPDGSLATASRARPRRLRSPSETPSNTRQKRVRDAG